MARESTSTVESPGPRGSRPRLPAVAGLRLIACLHIYLFHIMQAHQAGLLTFGLLDQLPSPVARVLARGFISTGLFFQLSGFLLAYAYLGADGRPKVGDREFWLGRFLRLYPLYFLSLVLLAPAPALLPITAKTSTPAGTAALVATNLTLTQAWFPSSAIAWNAPAWALSAFVPFYAAFPFFARRIAGLSEKALRSLLVVLIGAALVPAVLYMIINPADDAWTATSITVGGFWLSVLRFDPLVWLPQFLAGVVLGRLVILRHGTIQGQPEAAVSGNGLSRGDLAAVALLALLALVPGIPYVPLRHGLLSAATLAILADLAAGRGLLARTLSASWLDRAADASFGLFALQMPVGVWFAIGTLRSSTGTTAHLAAMIVLTLAAAVLWSEAVQRPLLRRLRRRKTGHGNVASTDPADEATERRDALIGVLRSEAT
jgi:peptidoglycan/LPS O-acetylase OafA/YrhL